MTQPDVRAFHDEATFTITYVVSDPATRQAAIVDPVLDFDAASGRTSTKSADEVVAFVEAQKLDVAWILETHVHADHLSGAPYLRRKLGGTTAIGNDVSTVQETFKTVFNLKDLATDGSQYDVLLGDDEELDVGPFSIKAHHAPGHTPACSVWHIGKMIFVGLVLGALGDVFLLGRGKFFDGRRLDDIHLFSA